MASEILLSFVVPVYNAEKSLSRCIDSILNQFSKCFEIIIVNDGSTDASDIIIDKYVSAFPNLIKSFKKENGGPGDSRNFGIRKANGSYIAFIDCDDFIEPNYVDEIKAIIDAQQPDMVIISYNRNYQRKQNLLERFHKFNDWNVFNIPVNINAMPEMICKLEVASWLRVVKKQMFLNADSLYFNKNSLAEDLEASLKWYLHTGKIIITDKKLYNYFINSNTLNFNTNNIRQFINIIDSVCTYYKKQDRFQPFYSELEYMFAKHILISNLLRLQATKRKGNFELFMALRNIMLTHFPDYSKNKYLISEPIYMRIAISVSYHFPKMFYPVL